LNVMLSGVQTLRDSAVEAALRTWATGATVINSSWAIDAEELQDVRIRWPAHYQWPTARFWVDTILYGLRQRVPLELAEIPQPYRGTVIFQFVREGQSHDVAIDYSDYLEINEDSASRCPVYFKMQHLRGGYDRGNVLPGGYVCDSRKIYPHLARLRRLRDRRQFEFDVCGRFSTEFARETRRRAVDLLSNQSYFRYEGGLKKVKYLAFLKEVARARVCIDLPGEGDFCFRLMNYMAVGACIVGPRPRTTLQAPLIDRVHIAYTKDDLSDLVDVCRYYLEHESEREEMCLNSRRFFDEYLHKDNLSAYYLRSCLDRLPG